jgi:uncharacterized coiled-coil protein SlyX
MPRPLKVSEKGAPLTCAEHDENINRLLDRSNHTGTQSASTIHDLAVYLANSSSLSGLTTQLTNLQSLVSSLQDDVLAPGGHVNSLISQLQSAYTSADNLINNRLNSYEARITGLETGHSNQQGLIDNLNQRVNTLTTDTATNTQAIDALDTQVSTLSSLLGGNDVSGMIGDISAIMDILQPVIDGDSFIVPSPPNNNDGLIFGWDSTSSTPIWRFPDNINGGDLVDPTGTVRLNLSSN